MREQPTIFIGLEGIDGSGKSTVQEGLVVHAKDFDAENKQIPGLAARLEERGHNVIKTCEPGEYPTGPIALESNLNKTGYILHLAVERAEDPFVKGILETVRFMTSEGMDCIPEDLYETLLNGEAPTGLFYDEDYQMLSDFCSFEPSIRRTVEKASLRQLIRHALVHTLDGEVLCPDATGLLFFANHLVHCTWLEKQKHAVFVSDRSKMSQYAYSAPRGDCRVWELYKAHSRHDPDFTVLLTCDPQEAVERVVGRTKSEEKHWAGVSFMRKTQEAYLEHLDGKPHIVIDTTDLTSAETIVAATDAVLERLSRLSHNSKYPQLG